MRFIAFIIHSGGNKNTPSKNTLEGTNSRITEAEDGISDVEDRMVEINEAEEEKRKNN